MSPWPEALEKVAQRDAALVHRRLVVEIRPDDAAAAFALGASLTQLGRLAEAEQIYRNELVSAPHSLIGHYNFGALLTIAGRLDEAIGQFHEALRIDPEFAPAWHRLGLVQTWIGQSDLGVQALEEARRLDPGSRVTVEDLAWCLATNPRDSVRKGARSLRTCPTAPIEHLAPTGCPGSRAGGDWQSPRSNRDSFPRRSPGGQGLVGWGRHPETRSRAMTSTTPIARYRGPGRFSACISLVCWSG